MRVSVSLSAVCVLWPLFLESGWQTPLPSCGSEGSSNAGVEQHASPASAALGSGRGPGQILNLTPTFSEGFLALSTVPGK